MEELSNFNQPQKKFLQEEIGHNQPQKKFLQEEIGQHVRSIGRWYTFFGVLAVIGTVFTVLGGISCIIMGIVMLTAGALSSEIAEAINEAGYAGWMMIPMGILYLLCSGLYIPIAIYLLRGGKSAREAVDCNSDRLALDFLHNTHKFWRLYGILTIIAFGFCLIAFPIAFIVGALSAM